MGRITREGNFFLVPSQTQALIWADLVPQLILSAKIPRWWNVTPAQMHWLGLHVRYAESLLGEAAVDPAVREAAMSAGVREVLIPCVRMGVDDIVCLRPFWIVIQRL